MTDQKSGAPDGDGGDGISDQGFDRWLNRQLHRLYDPVLSEDVPEEIMRLLREFDDRSPSAPPPPGLPTTKRPKPGKLGKPAGG